ncbi:hypothetical protein TYRP_021465, partial [Tyrophagus putrescentiae]
VFGKEEKTSQYNCSLVELDKLDQISARILSLTEHQRRFPEAVVQIQRYCKETKEDLSLVAQQSGKCLTGASRQFANVLLYSVKANMKRYCSMRNRRHIRQSLLMGRCMNRNLRPSEHCLAAYIDALQRGKLAPQREHRIGYACCHYFQLISCLESVTRAACSARQADLIGDFIRNLFSDVVAAACADFEEHSDVCERLPEAPKVQGPEEPKTAAVRTFTLPLVELWNHL